MIKIMLLLLSAAIISCSSTGSKTMKNSESINMSPQTRIFLQELLELDNSEDGILPDEFINKYKIKDIEGDYYIGAIIKVKDKSPDFPDNSGIIVRTVAGNILTLFVNVIKFEDLLNYDEITYIQIDENVDLINKRKK